MSVMSVDLEAESSGWVNLIYSVGSRLTYGSLPTFCIQRQEMPVQGNFIVSSLFQLETECKTLEEELNVLKESHSKCASDLQEAKQSLETTNKMALKMKAQIKALKIENTNLKKDGLHADTLESLQNRIALLEEEKGNLQLQLVDFEESKGETSAYGNKKIGLGGSAGIKTSVVTQMYTLLMEGVPRKDVWGAESQSGGLLT
ncbi:hypothetical protein AAG570_005440 [Ranatra chinensis]|uniref:Uncharacterized protein n=1 Tax=Ranatra chinensis TaxID=642074 RepID=A0ABD0Y012_9HEMI